VTSISRERAGISTAALLLLALLPLAAQAALLGSVRLKPQDGLSMLDVRFECALRYVQHFPSGSATELEIEFAPVAADCEELAEAESVLELRLPAGSQQAGLNQVEIVARNDRLFLTVRFEAPRKVAVTQAPGLRSVQLTLGRMAAVDDGGISAKVRTGVATTGGTFAINLRTASEPVGISDSQLLPENKQVYAKTTVVGRQTWHHLRVGFFSSEGRAEAALQSLRNGYPQAIVVRVPAAEFQVAATNRVAFNVSTDNVAVTEMGKNAVGLSEARLDELLGDARKKMQASDYLAAIGLYAKVLREGATRFAPEALEYTGLARERNKQPRFAMAEYQRYLDLYGDTPGADRVRQRLEALVLAEPVNGRQADAVQAAPRTMPTSEAASQRKAEPEPEWRFYGGLSQYYRRDENDFSGQSSRVVQSAVFTDVDFIGRRDGKRFDISTRVSLGNVYDLLSELEGTGNDTRVYYMYADIADSESNISGRIGRQTLRGSGVLGRFDGLHVGWRFDPDYQLNVMAGEPVYSTSDDGGLDRSFYGVSLDVFDVRDTVDLTVYFNAQEVDGIENRQAIGGEMRYYDDRRSLVSLVDYDIGYGTLNNAVAFGNWRFDNDLTLNATLDYRRAPYLLTENALTGQAVRTIDELLLLFSEDEIRQLAEDRSADLTTITLGFSRPLYERFQISADVTASDLGGTAASGGVPALDGLGADYFYNVSLIGSSLFKEGDSSIFSLRYHDGSTTRTISLSTDTRYPVTRSFRFNPRLTLAHRDSSSMDASEVLIIPSIRLFYQMKRRLRFELEGGTRLSSLDTASGSQSSSSWYLYAGYRYDF